MTSRTIAVAEGELTVCGYRSTQRIDIGMEQTEHDGSKLFAMLTMNAAQAEQLIKQLRRVRQDIQRNKVAHTVAYAAINSKGNLIAV